MFWGLAMICRIFSRARDRVFLFLCIVLAIGLPSFAHAQFLTGYTEDRMAPVMTVPDPIVPVDPIDPVISRSPSSAFDVPLARSNEPVDFQADTLEHDDQSGIVTASGDVMIVQAGRILRADEVQYNLRTEQVQARGHVVLNEENGDIYYSDYVELENGLKDGVVQGLKSYMGDGTRFSADGGHRKNGTKTVMGNASYTPCRVCSEDEFAEYTPAWRLKASKVVHDKEDKTIAYQDARMEI